MVRKVAEQTGGMQGSVQYQAEPARLQLPSKVAVQIMEQIKGRKASNKKHVSKLLTY